MTRAPDELPEDPRTSATLAGCLYLVLGGSAWLWLWARERLAALPERAIGTFGLPADLAMGIGVGVVGALLVGRLGRGRPFVDQLERQVRTLFVPMSEAAMLILVLVGALAEELFFRLAAQDALGLPGAVAVYAFVNSSTAGWRWLPISLVHALVFGALFEAGFGLLGTTAANAILNHLSLRRILSQ